MCDTCLFTPSGFPQDARLQGPQAPTLRSLGQGWGLGSVDWVLPVPAQGVLQEPRGPTNTGSWRVADTAAREAVPSVGRLGWDV